MCAITFDLIHALKENHANRHRYVSVGWRKQSIVAVQQYVPYTYCTNECVHFFIVQSETAQFGTWVCMGNYAILFQHIWHNVHNSEMTTYVRILLIVSGDASDMDQHTHSTDLLYHTFQI